MVAVKPQSPIINWGNPLTQGLVHEASMWENSGNQTIDSFLKLGTFNGATKPAWVKKLLGTGLSFDGATSYIDFPTTGKYTLSGTAISIENWILTPSSLQTGQLTEKPVASGSHNSPFFDYANMLITSGTTWFRIWVTTTGNTTGQTTGTGISLSANTLYHLVGVYNGTTLQTYVNAVADQSALASGTLRNDSSPLRIGANGAPGEFFNGIMFSSRIWNRPLSATEVKTLYQNPWQIYKQLAFSIFKGPEVIAFESAANSSDVAAASSYSGSASWSGNNRMLSIDVSMLGPGVNVTAMTYGGANCTFIGSKSTVTSLGGVECWRIIQSDSGAPAAGANTLSVTLSGSIEFSVEWVAYSGVHQTSPTEAFNSAQATNSGSATDASVVVTTVADNDWVHAAVVANDTSITAGNTTRNNISGTLGSGGNEDNNAAKTPAGAVTMSYTGMGITTTWAIAGYAIRPVAASSLAVIVARLRALLGVGL